MSASNEACKTLEGSAYRACLASHQERRHRYSQFVSEIIGHETEVVDSQQSLRQAMAARCGGVIHDQQAFFECSESLVGQYKEKRMHQVRKLIFEARRFYVAQLQKDLP